MNKCYIIQIGSSVNNNTGEVMTLYEALERLQEIKPIISNAKIVRITAGDTVDHNIIMRFRGFPVAESQA